MSRSFLLAGNWKLHHAPDDARALAHSIRQGAQERDDIDVLVFPSALAITAVVDTLSGSEIGVGVQDVEVAPQGAYTGANSATHARSAGCTHALVGHSERRQLYGDSDEKVHDRLLQALDAGLLVVLCIGETLAERQSGQEETVIDRQLAATLDRVPVDRWSAITLAYEPVWAIGTGVTASPEQAQQMHAFIRSWIRERSRSLAEEMRVLYGGSVKPLNAAELLACADIDGALIGGASLHAESFLGILNAARSLS